MEEPLKDLRNRVLVPEHARSGRPPPRVGLCPPERPEDEGHDHTEGEAADVRPERDARSLTPGEAHHPEEKLEGEPEADDPPGWNADDEEADPDADPHLGEEHEVGAEHPGDRPRGPDGGHEGSRIRDR